MSSLRLWSSHNKKPVTDLQECLWRCFVSQMSWWFTLRWQQLQPDSWWCLSVSSCSTMQSVVCGTGAVLQPLQRRQPETGKAQPLTLHISFCFVICYKKKFSIGEGILWWCRVYSALIKVNHVQYHLWRLIPHICCCLPAFRNTFYTCKFPQVLSLLCTCAFVQSN